MPFDTDNQSMLYHERLDAYQQAIEFIALSTYIIEGLPSGCAHLADQLKRAALSIPLNIAEGTGKTKTADKKRFYAIARGSAMECGAILDVARVLRLAEDDDISRAKALLVRIVSMLTKMCR